MQLETNKNCPQFEFLAHDPDPKSAEIFQIRIMWRQWDSVEMPGHDVIQILKKQHQGTNWNGITVPPTGQKSSQKNLRTCH